jgi:hypothetical protein
MKTLSYNRIHQTRFSIASVDYITLSSSPLDEQCTQAGGSLNDMQTECQALKDQMLRTYGPEPENTEFFIMENYHDFGTYLELAFLYPDNEEQDEASALIFDYLDKIQTIPDLWDEISIQYLIKNDHSSFRSAKIIQLRTA